MRTIAVLALVSALIACKSKSEPPPAPAPAAASIDAAPPPQDNHALALAVCPKVAAPYLFTVEKSGHRSYLLGTRHLGVGLDRMPPAVTDAIAHAKLAVFEIAPGDERDPDDQAGPSLADGLGKDRWAHYRALVGDDVAAAVEHEKPAIAIILMMAAFEDPSTSLDQELEEVATHAKIETRGLETSAFQDGLIDQLLDQRALAAAVTTTATRDELRKDTVDDLGDYCRGDKLDRTTKDEDDLRKAGYSDAEIARYDDLLLFGRNRAWIPKLEPIFDGGDAFVAVGLDHLLGDRGVIAALRADGYQVTRFAP